MKRIRKAMALLFALVLCLGMLPGAALAAGKNAAWVEKTDSKIEKTTAAASSRDGMLTFSSDAPFTLETANHQKNWNGTLEYSTDAQTWTTWNGAATLGSAAHNGQQRLYLRGIGNRRFTLSGFQERWVLTGSGIACSGNIENILNYQTVAAGIHPEMYDDCFRNLFYGCAALTTAPELLATTLTYGCYCGMFKDCVNLTTAPELPAMTLEPFCYEAMFKGCTALSSVPELPATTLANGCYQSMFWGCTSLTTPTAFPATDLPERCYHAMFFGCSGIRLSEIPMDEYNVPYKIPSVEHSQNVVPGALDYMFRGTGGPFTGTPQADRVYYLPGNGIQPGNGMLTFVSDARFTLETGNHAKNWDGTLEYSTDASHWTTWNGEAVLSSALHNDQQSLYLRGTGNKKISGSESERWVLTSIGGGSLPQTGEPPQRWLINGAEIACSGNIENLLDYQTVAAGEHPEMVYSCYMDMFYGCTLLTTAPELSALTLAPYCYTQMFWGCTSLTAAPELPATELASHCYSGMFNRCSRLMTAPALPATTLTNSCYSAMFQFCKSLTTAPVLPAMTLTDWCYSGMFVGCTSLTTAPALPATTLAPNCYSSMFSGCASLTTAPTLPAEITAPRCYERMFKNCEALTQIPLLPAHVLEDYCYHGMFYGCTGIKLSAVQTEEYNTLYRIPCVGYAQNIGTDATSSMFSKTGGPFTFPINANTTYYIHNSNSIVG